MIFQMNLSKTEQKRFVTLLYEANQLIDEQAYTSSKRIIADIINELNDVELKHEKWRKKKNG